MNYFDLASFIDKILSLSPDISDINFSVSLIFAHNIRTGAIICIAQVRDDLGLERGFLGTVGPDCHVRFPDEVPGNGQHGK